MKNLTPNQQNKLKLIRMSLNIPLEADDIPNAEDANPAVCAELKREVNLRYLILVIFEVIIVIFSLIVLALLALGAWKIANGATYEALLSGAVALVSGGAALYLNKLRKDARDAWRATLFELERLQCPALLKDKGINA